MPKPEKNYTIICRLKKRAKWYHFPEYKLGTHRIDVCAPVLECCFMDVFSETYHAHTRVRPTEPLQGSMSHYVYSH